MKRPLAILALALLAFVLVRWACGALVSDEARIRGLVAGMVDGFNEGSAKGATAGLAETWTHAGETLRRDDLRGYLLATFQQQRTQKARRLTLRVRVPEESLTLAVEGDRATFALEAEFEKLAGEEWRPQWRMRVEGALARGEDGWRIVETRKTDLEGDGLRG